MFSGQFTSRRKVALGGRSRQEESREEVLQRTRADRERRKQQKLEQKSATYIQAFWRGRAAWRQYKHILRQQWIQQYGEEGGRITLDCVSAFARCARCLLSFCDIRDDADVRRLAALCRAILSTRTPAGHLCFCGGPFDRQSCYQAWRLSALALESISTCPSTQSLMEHPHRSRDDGAQAWVLMDSIFALTDAGSWESPSPLGSPATRVVLLLASPRSGMFRHFRRWAGKRPLAAPPGGRVVPAYERLLSTLAQRYLQAYSAGPPATASLPSELAAFMSTPLLWTRCPSLLGTAVPVWDLLVRGLAESQQVFKWLPEDSPGGSAASAAGLLGNLLEASPRALAEQRGGAQGGAATGVQACMAFLALLGVLPLAALFPGEEQTAEEVLDDEEAGDAMEIDTPGAITGAASSHAYAWGGTAPPPVELRAQLELCFDPKILQPLVSLVLPEQLPGGGDAWEARPLLEADSARWLCKLLRVLLNISKHVGAASPSAERLLTGLAFSAGLVQRLWHSYLRPRQADGRWEGSHNEQSDPGWMLPLVVVCPVYSCTLNSMSADDNFPLHSKELYDPDAPRKGFLELLKTSLWQLLWADSAPPPAGWPPEAAAIRHELKVAGGTLLRQLHDRNASRRFAPPEGFLAEGLSHDRFATEAESSLAARGGWGSACASSSRAWAVLQHAPCLVPFQQRARVFQVLVFDDRAKVQDRESMRGGPNTFFSIRRDHIVEDGFDALNSLGEGLKRRVRVQFVNQFGEAEAGVDGGGLFKDFLYDIVKTAFDPQYGFFKETSDHFLYPNPAAGLVHEQPGAMFEFMGRILGKAIYEGILLELPLAGFFLKKFQSLRRNDINDLPSLDPELHKQLMFLRSYEGDVSDLALTFSISDSQLGRVREVELIPGGSSIPVTNENRISYIFFVANHHLNRVIAPACASFLRGVHELIPPQWLHMFNEQELRELISGSMEGMDVQDLKANVQYAGGYHEEHPVILLFWETLQDMSPSEQEAFLRFVTSCSRPPLLGFKYLEPQLCVQVRPSLGSRFLVRFRV